MAIPDFLKPENRKPLTPEDVQFRRLREEYREMFGDYPTTEPAGYTTEEWIEFFIRCLKENITIFELLDGELETGDEEHDYIIIIE